MSDGFSIMDNPVNNNMLLLNLNIQAASISGKILYLQMYRKLVQLLFVCFREDKKTSLLAFTLDDLNLYCTMVSLE